MSTTTLPKLFKTKKGPQDGNWTRKQIIREGQISSTPTNEARLDNVADITISPILSPGSDLLAVENLHLYPSVSKWYEENGMRKMFPWQKECLETNGVLSGKNLVFSAPTSAGKTFVSDIILMKRVFEDRKKVLVVVPYVSMVREKMTKMQEMMKDTHLRVGGFMGNHHTKGGFDGVDIAICTVEKANNYVIKLLNQNKLDILGAVIVDELHLVNEKGRGFTLELLLSKIVYSCQKNDDLNIQVVGMSATMPNVSHLGQWLHSKVYESDFRPVPLKERIYIGNCEGDNGIYEKIVDENGLVTLKQDTQATKGFNQVKNMLNHKYKNDFSLTPEAIFCRSSLMKSPEQWSTLIFYNNKEGTENVAKNIANMVAKLNIVVEKVSESAKLLEDCQIRVGRDLLQVVKLGVAFHHAGLCGEHREIIEEGFKKGQIKVLVATSTLASGVNLPARRVLIKTPNFGKHKMNILTYKQMIGRAGRKGLDDEGESVLICSGEEEAKNGKELVTDKLPLLHSSLLTSLESQTIVDWTSLQKALLESLVTGIISNKQEVMSFLTSMFIYQDIQVMEKDILEEKVDEIINYLVTTKCIEIVGETLVVTQLGKACIAANVYPDEGLSLLADLQKARKRLVINCDLHLLYFIVPQRMTENLKISNDIYRNILTEYYTNPEYEYFKDVTTVLQIIPGKLPRHLEFLPEKKKKEKDDPFGSYRKFFVAVILDELIQEKPLDQLENKFGINKGTLQSLQNSAASFAAMVAAFCNRLGWTLLDILFDHLQQRLEFGVQRDLIELMRIPSINARLARKLYNASLTAVTSVASSDLATIRSALMKGEAFETSSPIQQANQRVWINTLKKTLNYDDISQLLQKEARQLIQEEVGKEINWEQDVESIISNDSDESRLVIQSRSKSRKASIETPKKLFSMEKLTGKDGKKGFQKQMKKIAQRTSVGDHSLHLDDNLDPDKASQPPFQEPLHPITLVPSTSQLTFYTSSSVASTPCSTDSLTTSDEVSSCSPLKPKKLFLLTDMDQVESEEPIPMKRTVGDTLFTPQDKPSKRLRCENFEHSINPHEDLRKVHVKTEQDIQDFIDQLSATEMASFSYEVDKYVNQPIMTIGVNLGAPIPRADDAGIVFDSKRHILRKAYFCLGQMLVFKVDGQLFESFAQALRTFFENHKITLLVFDLMASFKILNECFQIDRKCLMALNWMDIRIGHWLRDPEIPTPNTRNNNFWFLNPKTFDFGSYLGSDYITFIENISSSKSFLCAIMFPLMTKIENQVLAEDCMKTAFQDLEIASSLVLADCSANGFRIDAESLAQLKIKIISCLKNLEEQAFKVAGCKFDLASPQAVAGVIFNKLNLLSFAPELVDTNRHRLNKNKRNNELPEHLTTSKSMMKKLAKVHPLPMIVLQHRKLLACLNTTVKHILEVVEASGPEGIARGRFETFTANARVTMSDPDPNLFSIERNFKVTLFRNDDTTDEEDISVRKSFVPSEGCLLLSADYSQLELRLLASLSQDENLLSILNSGVDVFKSVAKMIFGKEDITDDERQQAKSICYGIIYGRGKKSLADELEVTEEIASNFSESFYETFPSIKIFKEEVLVSCRKNGFIQTISGRKRFLPLINSSNSDKKSQAERQAINSKIQGSAADVIKRAMVMIHDEMVAKKLSGRLVLEMHDELIYDVKQEERDDVANLIRRSMSRVAQDFSTTLINVVLPVNIKIGKSWGELQEVPP